MGGGGGAKVPCFTRTREWPLVHMLARYATTGGARFTTSETHRPVTPTGGALRTSTPSHQSLCQFLIILPQKIIPLPVATSPTSQIQTRAEQYRIQFLQVYRIQCRTFSPVSVDNRSAVNKIKIYTGNFIIQQTTNGKYCTWKGRGWALIIIFLQIFINILNCSQ